MTEMFAMCDMCLGTMNSDTLQIDLTLPGGHQLFHCPVGVYDEDPYAIIVGKTADWRTFTKYHELMKTESDSDAARIPMFSGLRSNLFDYLRSIGFFALLAQHDSYWQLIDKKRWEGFFVKGMDSHGLTLTQACQCAIVRETGWGYTSKEPRNSIYQKVERERNCILRHVRSGKRTRLIVFLDTPGNDGRFHSEATWWMQNHGARVKTISITHPSSQNCGIYRYLPDLAQMPIGDGDTKASNALRIWRNAKATISELMVES